MLEAARVSEASLPVIDIGGLSSPILSDREQVASNLRAACLRNGFFYISNHGVDEALVADVFAEAAAFFDLPPPQKAEVEKSRSKANRGYEPLQGQTLESGAPPAQKAPAAHPVSAGSPRRARGNAAAWKSGNRGPVAGSTANPAPAPLVANPATLTPPRPTTDSAPPCLASSTPPAASATRCRSST